MNKEVQGSFFEGLFCQMFCLGCQSGSIVRVCELVCFVTMHGALQFVEATASEVVSVRFGCSECAYSYLGIKQVRV